MEKISNLVAVVIPCYRVTKQVLDVIQSIGPEVSSIYAIDDACPDHSGKYIESNCSDSRIKVLYHEVNQGVGAAVMTGYHAAIQEGADVIVKVDGDGQMDPSLIPAFIEPILSGDADYTKGNRLYDLTAIGRMPAVRIFGNAALSFLSKLSSGYWDLFDPTNGYTAISGKVAAILPLSKISHGYFFESDMLFRLGTFRAVVQDVPMDARYADEESNLKISRILHEFLFKHSRNFAKRIFYNYFLRDLSSASIELVAGTILLTIGCAFSSLKWFQAYGKGVTTPAGTVMIGAILILLGFQLLLAFVAHDASSTPRTPISGRLGALKRRP